MSEANWTSARLDSRRCANSQMLPTHGPCPKCGALPSQTCRRHSLPTPEDIAMLFANLGSDEQARFFNEVGRIASDWPAAGWTMQLQYITDDEGLSDRGRYVMATIGEYSHWGVLRAAGVLS